ncbi:MAG: purine-nucleoside phosphorylase [Robiginitomaculum sp.]|nr:MAG: purine-nucleoside phosphorylase [Robiginitomaculum sp.]
MTTEINKAAAYIRERIGEQKRLGIVLGSGLGDLADALQDRISIPYADIPGFPVSGVASHAGALMAGHVDGAPLLLLAGRAHYYEHGDAKAMVVPIGTLKALGIETLILTNAAGSLRKDVPPGSASLITDHINFSGLNPLIGAKGNERFVDLCDAYNPELRDRIRAVAKEVEAELHEGVYVWFSGPSFETPAEIRATRVMGGDLVGMSTVPEVILARHAGLRIGAVSLITNYAAGMESEELSHAMTMRVAATGAENIMKLFKGIIADLHANPLG